MAEEIFYSALHWAKKAEKALESFETLLPKAEEAANKAFWGNIGDIKYTARTTVPNGGAWCDGSTYAKADFEAVYKMLTEGTMIAVDMAEYDSLVAEKGSCGFFGLDTTTETFKVPTIPAMLLTKEQAAVVGNGMTLGLTDGTINTGLYHADIPALIGRAGAYGSEVGTPATVTTTFDDGKAIGITTDPTKSGIVANLDVVEYRAYIVLFTAEKELSVVDWTNRINEVAEERMAELQAGGLTTIKYWDE